MIQMLDREIPMPAPRGARVLLALARGLRRVADWCGALAFKRYGRNRWQSVTTPGGSFTVAAGPEGSLRVGEEWSVENSLGDPSAEPLFCKVLEVGRDTATVACRCGSDTWTAAIPYTP